MADEPHEENLSVPEKPLPPEQVQPPEQAQPEPVKPVVLPTNEEILAQIQKDLDNKNKQKMADEKTPPTTETTPKPEKPKVPKEKESTIPVVVKKDHTLLILAIGVLLISIGVYLWQNYRKRKDEENTIDGKFQDMTNEDSHFNAERQYSQYE